jgi:hypothetical protein
MMAFKKNDLTLAARFSQNDGIISCTMYSYQLDFAT